MDLFFAKINIVRLLFGNKISGENIIKGSRIISGISGSHSNGGYALKTLEATYSRDTKTRIQAHLCTVNWRPK